MPKKLIDSSSSAPLELQSEHSGVIRRIKQPAKQQNHIHDTNTNKELNTKRFSCDELEILKERFVDFIKLDQHQPTASVNSTESSQPPQQVVIREETEATVLSLFSLSSTNNLNKHSLIDNSTKQNHSTELFYKTNMDNYEHLPLPDPPPQFLIPSSGDEAPKICTNPIPIRSHLSSRLSVISSSESSSGAEYSLSSSSSTSSSSNRPEPPQRTVSIRNSSNNLSMIMDNLSINNDSCLYSRPIRLNNTNKEDCLSIKSSIYSSYRGFPSQHVNQMPANTIVRSSRSVFSIYEEEDENNGDCPASSSLSTTSSSSSSSTSPYSNLNMIIKLERLNEFEIKKIESMYRSIGSIVHVSSCTCDLYTTTSEQIANLLNDCWNLEQNSIVPVWLFDTGLNPKRPKQLRLLLVDKSTAFPFQSLNQQNENNCVISKPILINHLNKIKNPNCNEKRLTFTLNNKQLICLIQFYDLFTCKEFFKFYSDLENNPRHFNLFNDPQSSDDLLTANLNHNNTLRFKSMSFRKQIKKNQSQSMLSLTKTSVDSQLKNRYSELIEQTNNKFYKLAAGSLTTGNINQQLKQLQDYEIKITGITKNCISNPCAFQHISTLKNDDQRIRFLIENNKQKY